MDVNSAYQQGHRRANNNQPISQYFIGYVIPFLDKTNLCTFSPLDNVVTIKLYEFVILH